MTTDRRNPSWSAHQVTLTLPNNVTPLVLQLPWPFLSNEIQISLRKNKKGKKNRINLILSKSLHDPWPQDFGGRSKWDINCFRPWRDNAERGTFEMHIDAQFLCNDVIMEKRLFKRANRPALDEVREIIWVIFYGHHRNSFYLFAIYLHSDELVMHLKIQPPVRLSSDGSPLLLISVLDHQLAQQLISSGKLDPELNESDFHRIITERVSRKVCSIRKNLFRYSVRVNSTQMRRSAWQSKNLPRYEDNPCLPTFISPLYSCNTMGFCHQVLEGSTIFSHENSLKLRFRTSTYDYTPSMICANCYLKKVALKMCSRCKTISYCSVTCQKDHWASHKERCSSATKEEGN